jgi:hypothetical protein
MQALHHKQKKQKFINSERLKPKQKKKDFISLTKFMWTLQRWHSF